MRSVNHVFNSIGINFNFQSGVVETIVCSIDKPYYNNFFIKLPYPFRIYVTVFDCITNFAQMLESQAISEMNGLCYSH